MASMDFDLLHAARTEDLEDSQIISLAVLGELEKDIVQKLKFSGSHLLQGARGIGKSMLMKTAEVELDADFNKNRVLGVYVNFKTSTLLEGVKADNKDAFQIWVGAKILQALHEKLSKLNLISENDADDPFKRIFGISATKSSIKRELQEKIHQLQQLSLNSSAITNINAIGQDFIQKVNDTSYVNEIVRNVIANFKLERIVFLFDEAAHTFIPAQQEIFFEIFKLLHGGKVAVKAAVYPSVTSYGRNFEIGHDAILIEMGKYEAGNTGRQNTRDMYRNLFAKRIPEKGKLNREIFSKGELLDQCIHLASGNPRAFLHLFNRLYDRGYSERGLSLAAKDYVDQELIPYHDGLSKRLPKFAHHVRLGVDLLREYIIPEIRTKNNRDKKAKTQSAFFTLQRDLAPNLKLAFDLLCYSGILSKQGTVKIANKLTGQRYMVHLALLFTEKAFVVGSFTDVIQMISLTDYREFSSTDANFSKYLETLKSQADKCTKCSFDLPSNAKFCPQCATPVESQSIIGNLIDDCVRNISISSKLADRVEPEYSKVGDVIHAERKDIMKISYIKEVRSKIIKNAAEEYISG